MNLLAPPPLPTVCFNSHLSVDKRAVQSYSVTGEQHHVYTRLLPPLIPTKRAGDM